MSSKPDDSSVSNLFPAVERESMSRHELNLRQKVTQKDLRLNAYLAHELLVEATRRVQQHRGSVLGFLGQHCSFEDNIQDTRERSTLCLKLLADFDRVVDTSVLSELMDEWEAVSFISTVDTALNQFELHNHLITKLIDYNWKLIQQYDFLLRESEPLQVFAEILHKHFLALIEKTGQCRALATLITASAAGIPESSGKTHLEPNTVERQQMLLEQSAATDKLRFLLKTLFEDWELISMKITCLDRHWGEKMQALLEQYQCQHKINRLADLLERSVIGSESLNLKPESIYYLFTMAMDEFYRLFHDAVTLSQNQRSSLTF